MTNKTPPQDWQAPQWHADFGDPLLQLLPLKAFASRLISVEPNARIAVKTPEPGLLYLRGQLTNNAVFEVYSAPPLGADDPRRLGIFLNPDTDEEVEEYFDSPEEAVAFIVAQSLANARR